MTEPSRSLAQDLSALPNLGPVSARMLAQTGIPDIETLRDIGAWGVYRRLRFQFGRGVTVKFIYALECACRGLHWRLL